MANPAKRRVSDTAGDGSSDAPGGTAVPSTSTTSKRVTPPKAKAAAKRYTPPPPESRRPPARRWVPFAMFGLWALGLVLIVTNYMGVLPGSADGGNGWYLIAGLVAILGGIIAATQHR